MIMVISPAKKLDFTSPLNSPACASWPSSSQSPSFAAKTGQLVEELGKKTPKQLSTLMKISDSLANLNVQRYREFNLSRTVKNARPAIFAFSGDTYQGLQAKTFSPANLLNAQKSLRILSGLYGLLCPFDPIRPHRLEMGTAWQGSGKLDDFWKADITRELNKILKKQKNPLLINLASQEYFRAIDQSRLDGEIIQPIFKEKKGNDYRVVGILAKRARGMFAQYIIKNRITKVSDLKKFKAGERSYSAQHSDLSKNKLVFISRSTVVN